MRAATITFAILIAFCCAACDAEGSSRQSGTAGSGGAGTDGGSAGAGAGGSDPSGGEGGSEGGSSGSTPDPDREKGCEKMDILFIVDDSASMRCEQEKLVASFPDFMAVLDAYNNEKADEIDYRIGVTTTGLTVSISFEMPLVGPLPPLLEPGAMDGNMIPTGTGVPWIEKHDPNLTQEFSGMANVGTGGPSYEMPLQGMLLALDKTEAGKPNQGFLREDSLFILVIITDEDDCSTKSGTLTGIPNDQCMEHQGQPWFSNYQLVPLQEYKDLLDSRFGPDGYVVVTIAGYQACSISSNSCAGDDSSYAGAHEAVRLKDFLHNYIGVGDGKNGLFADICTADMPTALDAALDKMQVACDEYLPPIE